MMQVVMLCCKLRLNCCR